MILSIYYIYILKKIYLILFILYTSYLIINTSSLYHLSATHNKSIPETYRGQVGVASSQPLGCEEQNAKRLEEVSRLDTEVLGLRFLLAERHGSKKQVQRIFYYNETWLLNIPYNKYTIKTKHTVVVGM